MGMDARLSSLAVRYSATDYDVILLRILPHCSVKNDIDYEPIQEDAYGMTGLDPEA